MSSAYASWLSEIGDQLSYVLPIDDSLKFGIAEVAVLLKVPLIAIP